MWITGNLYHKYMLANTHLSNYTFDVQFNLSLSLVNSFVSMVKYIFTIPGVEVFLSNCICQDPLERFVGQQRQRGRVNENPKAIDCDVKDRFVLPRQTCLSHAGIREPNLSHMRMGTCMCNYNCMPCAQKVFLPQGATFWAACGWQVWCSGREGVECEIGTVISA